jgi:pyruvate dehydrogenase (quinone)/pyruvate decarboxylase
MADDSPFTTGGIGHLGTLPSSWIMKNCDTVLILGSTMPWIDYYPQPGQARGVQVDINSDRIGLRYPVEIGLIGEVRATLQGLLPLLHSNPDRTFLNQAQEHVRDWNGLLERIESVPRTPLRPQMVIRAFSDLLANDAVVTLDCGANTHFAARHLRLRSDQRLISPGMLDTMAPALPYAVACQLAFPGRQVAAIAGDGWLRHAHGGAHHGGATPFADQIAHPEQPPIGERDIRAKGSGLWSLWVRAFTH